ncbi:MAG TPA: hypothetical protein VF041_00255 [Gemmatimonadaceae bacterium]
MSTLVDAARRGARRLWGRRGSGRRSVAVLAVGLLTAAGPFDIALFATPKAPAARGHARLVYAQSPFGIAVTADGRASYDVQISATGLPEPSTLGAYSAYVAWAVTPDLGRWHRLGTVTNGTTTVGSAELNKFLLVITAEADTAPRAHAGPTVLHGTSPSGWLQSFLTHPLFRGVSQ